MCKLNNLTKKITTNGYFVKNNKDQGCYQANIYNKQYKKLRFAGHSAKRNMFI